MRVFATTTLIAVLCSPVIAQEAGGDLADNAALWYWRAFMTLEQYDDRVMEAVNAVMMSEGEDSDNRRQVRSFISVALPDLRRAAETPSCAFAADWENGFMVTLPHLAHLTSTAQLIEADATGAIATGDDETAAERIMLMLAMADHAAQEPVMLSHLLSARFIDRCAGLQEELNPDELSADTRTQLMASWSLVEHIGPEHLADAYALNQLRYREGARKRWSGDDGAQRMREDFRMMINVATGQSPQPGPSDSLDEQFEQWKALDEAVADAIRERDETRLQEIAGELRDGEHGWLAGGLTPNYQRAYDMVIQAEFRVRAMKQMLR